MDARFGWLVSYPKSGNTWMRMMLASLLEGGAPVDINRTGEDIGVSTFAEMDEFLGIESSEMTPEEIARAQPHLHAAVLQLAAAELTLRKVHDRYWYAPGGDAVFPAPLTRAAIYLLRDPRDVAVSYAYHRGLPLDQIIDIMADPAATIANLADGQRRQLPQPVGNWSEHVASWVDQREVPVVLLRYEDLRRNPLAGLRTAAEHLGISFRESDLQASVEAARFDVLKAQEQAEGFRERRSRATAPFFRRGVAGGWVDELTPVQQARIVADHGATMKRFGYL